METRWICQVLTSEGVAALGRPERSDRQFEAQPLCAVGRQLGRSCQRSGQLVSVELDRQRVGLHQVVDLKKSRDLL